MKCYAVAIILVLTTCPTEGRAQGHVERLFYYIDRESSFESLRDHLQQIDILAPVAYSVDGDGIVWGGVDRRVLALAREHSIPVMPLVHNPGFDQDMLSALLASDDARRRTIESLLDECRRYDYAGIQFDFENIDIDDRDRFTAFFRETADALHAAGFQISIAVVHRPDKFPGPTAYFKWLHRNWRAAYDLAGLAEAADFISVMTYSQHTRRTTPGPNAGLPWVRRNIDYFLEHVPPAKLSLGVPVVSQHWRTELDEERYVANARQWSRTLRHTEVMALLERFESEPIWLEEQGVGYAVFDNGGLFEWVFMENAASFELKYDLLQKSGLRGFSVWVLGHEDPSIWDLLSPRAR